MVPQKYDIERLVLVEARRRIDTIAEEFREAVLLPWCRKHHLEFIAGMGRTVTVFYTRDGRSFGSAEEASLEGFDARRIFDVLDQEAIGHNDYFGFYVRDVRADSP